MKTPLRVDIRYISNTVGHLRRTLANHLALDGELRLLLNKIDNGLISASDNALNILEQTQIQCEGKEPLDVHEEAIFHNLQAILALPDSLFTPLTHEQKFSAARVINKQGGQYLRDTGYLINFGIRYPVATSEGYLGISFGHIFIGIEKDGYAHS